MNTITTLLTRPKPGSRKYRFAGHSPVIHLKDKVVVVKDSPVIAAIGESNLPWNTILPACANAGVEWYAIEQDTCRRSSCAFLTAQGLKCFMSERAVRDASISDRPFR